MLLLLFLSLLKPEVSTVGISKFYKLCPPMILTATGCSCRVYHYHYNKKADEKEIACAGKWAHFDCNP